MRNRVIYRNSRAGDSPFRLLAAALAVLTLTLLAVMVPCEGEARAAAPIKVACVGDSLTDGSKSSGGKKGDTAYPAWLGRILGSGYDVRNFGAAGDTLLRGTGWSYWDSAEFRQSKEFAPDIVIIMLGTNDSKDAYWNETLYRTGAKELVRVYRDLASRPVVYFASSPHSYRVAPGTKYVSVNSVNRLHPVQESLIRDERWNTIDLYAATANRRQLYDADGVHFNDDGYRFLAEQIAGVMHRSAQIIGSTGRERVIANETENGATKRAGVEFGLTSQGTAAGNAGDSSDGNEKRDALRGSDAVVAIIAMLSAGITGVALVLGGRSRHARVEGVRSRPYSI